MTTFYFYFNSSDLSLTRVSDSPNEVLENHFRMQHDLNSLDDLPTDWKSNPTILMKILKAYRRILILTSDEMWIEAKSKSADATAIETYKQALRDMGALDLTGETLDTLIALFPVQPSS